jgi:hypothetical protein
VPDRDDDDRRDRGQRAIAAGLGAVLGSAAGPIGSVVGAVLGPLLEPLIRGVWGELSASAHRRQENVLASAIHAGVPLDEMEDRINASERTQLLTGLALGAATRTASEDKVRTLGRSLASGLLAEDDSEIDTEQMIIAAIADIEGPQLAMLELLVAWRPQQVVSEPAIVGPLNLPAESHARFGDGRWDAAWREWSGREIAYARPNLVPLAPSLLGTLQRHGLVIQNDQTRKAIERYAKAAEQKADEQLARQRGGRRHPAVPRVGNPGRLVPERSWSPTELGEQVYLRFRDAGTDMDGGWNAGPRTSRISRR